MHPFRAAAIAATVLAASTALAAPVCATPPRDVTGTIIWEMNDGTGPDAKTYVFREITIAPGGSTGWHSHAGELLATVKEGILMHNRADCSVDGIYVAGQDITEKGGSE
jgi:quercetin dioxygenase-like cupin family protein